MQFLQSEVGTRAGSRPDPGVCAAHVLLLASTTVGFGPKPELAFSEGSKRVQMCVTHSAAFTVNTSEKQGGVTAHCSHTVGAEYI